MRSFLLATFAALALPACTQDITGGTGGDDDQGGATCGNGTVEAGETCDDSNTTSGDGCSSACQTETANAPRIAGSSDKPTVTTELNKTETIQLTIASQMGFAGTVNIVGSVEDSANAPVAKAVVTVQATADVSADGMVTVPVMVAVAPDTTGAVITGALKLKLTATGINEEDVNVPFTINNIFTVDYIDGTGTAPANHAVSGGDFTIKKGALLHFKNDDTSVAATQHVIHADGVFPHQDPRADPATQTVGMTYEINTANLTLGSGTIGCHDHTAATYSTYTLVQ